MVSFGKDGTTRMATGNRMNGEEKKHKRRLNMMMWGIVLVVLAAELFAAYVVLCQEGRLMNDAMSRTANAYYVLNIKPMKLASIGFVWNPLPSFLQIPILLFTKYWRPLATVGYAGAIVCSVFAAINAGLIFRYLYKSGVNGFVCLVITMLYVFNPFIFYYGFNGMSETMFFTAVIVSTINMILWIQDRQTKRLITVALMQVLAFLTRYEAFPLAVGFGVALIVAVYFTEDRLSPFKSKPRRMQWDYLVASGTMLFLPICYVLAIWIFLNWTIMGDPFYFFGSAYSNSSQSQALWEGFIAMVDTPFEALIYTLKRTVLFLPVFIVIAIERFYTKRLFQQDFLILILIIGSLAGFHWLMLWKGASFGWLRFYSFALPIAVAWLPYELTQLQTKVKNATIVGVCAALLFSGIGLHYAIHDEDVGREEYPVLFMAKEDGMAAQMAELAEVINEKYADSTILVDSFLASVLILNLDHPENLITTTSDEFDEAVIHPLGQDVEYIVLPGTEGAGGLDAINNAYPNLYSDGAAWLELVEQTDYHKVYRILEDEYYETIKEYGVLVPGKVEIELDFIDR